MNRRSFLMRIGGVMVAAPTALYATSCGGGSFAEDFDASLGRTSFQVTNFDNAGHTHSFTIQCAELSNQNGMMYTAVNDTHDHTISLSGGQLATIMSGTPVVISFTDGHAHTFTITKPDNAC